MNLKFLIYLVYILLVIDHSHFICCQKNSQHQNDSINGLDETNYSLDGQDFLFFLTVEFNFQITLWKNQSEPHCLVHCQRNFHIRVVGVHHQVLGVHHLLIGFHQIMMTGITPTLKEHHPIPRQRLQLSREPDRPLRQQPQRREPVIAII